MLAILTTLTLSVLSPQTPPTSQPTKQGPSTKTSWTGVLDEKEFAKLHELKKGKTPKLHGKAIRIGGAKAYLTLPSDLNPKAKAPTSAVLVIHEWWGLNRNVKHWTDRLAADGYAALAIDLYGGIVATTPATAMESMQAVDKDKALKTLKAAHEFLKTDPRVAAQKRACIGWCFGGGWSLRLALAAPDLDAAVIYYGRLVQDQKQLRGISAPILGVFGNKDKGIPPRAVDAFADAMQTAGKKLKLRRYDANHAFANPSSARYDSKHAAAAWGETRKFLRQHLATAKAKSKGGFVAGTARLQYDAPKGWKKVKNRSSMRLLTLAPQPDCECYVTILGGKGGGIGPNVNRWRGQMGKDPLSAKQIQALPKIDILGRKGVYARIDGAMGDQDEAIMLTAICELDRRAVFVKMSGPKAAMEKQVANFKAFCASMR